MCMTRLSELPLDKPVTIEPMKAFPVVERFGHRRLVEFRVKKKIKNSSRVRPMRPTAPGGCSRRTSIGCRNSANASNAFFARTSATCCAIIRSTRDSSARGFLIYVAALEMHPLDTEDRIEELRKAQGIGYCNITKCCTKVCPENIQITDNGIIPLKERVVDDFYDPLGWFWRWLKKKSDSRIEIRKS